MTVASWEFWSLANMLIITHGDDAEEEASHRLNEAIAIDDSGQKVVWIEVAERLRDIRLEQANGGQRR